MILVFTAAAAVPEGRYALRGTVSVADDGPVRIDLGPEWVARCPDPTSYALVDPDGRELAYASRTSDTFPPERERLTWEPTQISASTWMYRVHPPSSGAPTHTLSIRGVPRGRVVRAVVSHQGRVVARGLVWNLPDTGAGVRDTVALPVGAARGPWDVDLRTVSSWRWRPWAEFEAVTERVEEVAPVRWSVDVDPPVPVTASTSRLTVPLPRGGLPVRGVRLVAADRVFSRTVAVKDGAGEGLGSRRLERFTIGAEPIDVDRVPVHATPSRWLELDVTDDRSMPLDVERVELELRGLALLVPTGSAGTWTVYGCGPVGETYDLERLGDALVGERTPRVRPTAPEPNDRWTAELVIDGVAGPGQPLSGPAHALGRIVGPPGLVRIRLTPEVLGAVDADLGDLRIVDAVGRQVPFLTDDAGSVPVHGLDWSVVDEGPITVMEIGLPLAGLPLEQLVLYAERGRFERRVELRGADGPISRTWSGTGDPISRLVIPLHEWGPARIELRIDNGANAPLPLLPPRVSMGTSDAWLVLPPGGAVLAVGAAHARPRYDLELVRREVIDGPALPGSVVPPVSTPDDEVQEVQPTLAPPRRKVPYRWATALIAGCALLIGGMTIRLARSESD